MKEQSTAPPYSEEESTRWLAWLAYHMRERDLTVFEIEGLQPDWLMSVREKVIHLIFARLFWGTLSTLIFVLIFELTQLWVLRSALTLTSTLVDGLIIGPIFGMMIGIIESVNLIYKSIFFQNSPIFLFLKRKQADFLSDSYHKLRTFSSIIKSLFVGMITYGLIGFMIGRIIDWTAREGLISTAGIIAGFVFGLIEFLAPAHKLNARFQIYSNTIKKYSIGIIKYSLIGSLVWYFVSASHLRISDGLINGLIFGLIYAYRVTRRNAGASVYTFEFIQWSWRHVRKNVIENLIIGLVFGLIIGPILDRTSTMIIGEGELAEKIVVGPIEWILLGLVYALLGGILFGGFQPVARVLKSRPNQGIWTTIQSAVKIGIRNGLILGIGMMFGSLLSGEIKISVFYGLAIFFATTLWYGGLDVIEHTIIRLIIAWRGHAPLNYARFLDYAANELNFLQKVGGGYVFIHRYLLEHFAEIAVERGYVDVNARRHPQSY